MIFNVLLAHVTLNYFSLICPAHICIYLCVCMCPCLYVHRYICICVHMHMEVRVGYKLYFYLILWDSSFAISTADQIRDHSASASPELGL